MRTKTVFPKSEVAHLFANKIQDEARSSCGNLFYRNNTIYSYGNHFPIARHVELNGNKAVLYTEASYSNTTAKHKSIVRSAIGNQNIIYCFSPTDSHDDNLEKFHSKIESELRSLLNARKKELYINSAKIVFQKMEKYCIFFQIPIPEKTKDMLNEAIDGRYVEYLSKEKERIENEQKEKEVLEFKKAKTAIKKWRQGKTNILYGKLFGKDYLRVADCNIETSQGVKVPLDVAKKTFQYIQKVVSLGGSSNDGTMILHYPITEINKNEIVVGCHNIEMKEINKIAKKLNW